VSGIIRSVYINVVSVIRSVKKRYAYLNATQMQRLDKECSVSEEEEYKK